MQTSNLEAVLDKFKKENNGDVCVVPISDLVLMQMVGNFDNFLKTLVSQQPGYKDEAAKLVEEARGSTTATKLFKEIVRKTIEVQFGDKNATLRELGQNGMDSYNPGVPVKKVVFNLDESNEDKVHDGPILRVRDFGVGMGPEQIVRDLLIPYNSGKEMDPTKIGEHGIGWYSVVDLASHVRVVSRSADSPNTSQALIFRQPDGECMAALAFNSNGGFDSRLGESGFGTEVAAFIPQQKLTKSEMLESLYQHLGMVRDSDVVIEGDGAIINNIRRTYKTADPVTVRMCDGKSGVLTMGVSKRAFDANLADPSFKARNQNLEQILYTQRGLFIKYDSNPFRDESIHSVLMDDLLTMGVDFWVEVPNEATLTKGRNNVIADDASGINVGMYLTFENIFLDTVLADDELLYGKSDALLKSLGGLFAREVAPVIYRINSQKYSIGRRIASNAANIASTTIDIGCGLGRLGVKGAKAIGRGAKQTLEFIIEDIPHGIMEEVRRFKKDWPENKPRYIHAGKVAASTVAIATPVIYGGYKLYEKIGIQPLLKLGIGVGIAAGTIAAGGGLCYLGRGIYHDISERIEEAKKNPQYYDLSGFRLSLEAIAHAGREFRTEVANIGRIAYNATGQFIMDGGKMLGRGCKYVIDKVGLYKDVEEKRKKKRERIEKALTKRYLSKIGTNSFMRQIMAKKIIPATYYYSTQHKPKADAPRRTAVPTLGEIFEKITAPTVSTGSYWRSEPGASWQGNGQDYGVDWKRLESCPDTAAPSRAELQKKEVKISIEDLIKIYMEQKLVCQTLKGAFLDINKHNFMDGEYFVDSRNPLVNTVVNQIMTVGTHAHLKYDVKVLEDRLDNVISFGKEAFVTAYMFSGIGFGHMVLRELFWPKDMEPINSGVARFVAGVVHDARQGIQGWYESPQKFDKTKEVSLYVARKLAAAGCATGRGLLRLASPMNPVRYPGYAEKMQESFQSYVERRRLVNNMNPHQPVSWGERFSAIGSAFAKCGRKVGQYTYAAGKRVAHGTEEVANKTVESIKRRSRYLFEKSVLYYYIGGQKLSQLEFDNMTVNKLQDIIRETNTSEAYVPLMRTAGKMSEVIAEATGIKAPEVVLAFHGLNQDPYCYRSSLASTKQKLHINLHDSRLSELAVLAHPHPEMYANPDAPRINLAYRLFDSLIHQKVHELYDRPVIEKRFFEKFFGIGAAKGKKDVLAEIHTQSEGEQVRNHEHLFFELKEQVRAKVLAYMESQGKTPADYVVAPENREYPVFAYVDPSTLRDYSCMPRRILAQIGAKNREIVGRRPDAKLIVYDPMKKGTARNAKDTVKITSVEPAS